MTEEEYFRKNYPDFCYGDKPLSPHWDLFQYGVEFGERQSEKKIEELEKGITELKAQNEKLETRCNELFFQVNEQNAQIEKLEQENRNLNETLDLRKMMLNDDGVIIQQMQEQIDKLEHELKAEKKMRQYWHEEYIKEVEKE